MVDADLINDFVADSLDLIDSVEPSIIELQRGDETTGAIDTTLINSVFRLFHSIKGTAGFLSFTNMVSLTHAVETVLDLFRQKKLPLTPALGDLIFRAVDLIRSMLTHAAGKHNDTGFEEAVQALVLLLNNEISDKEEGEAQTTAADTQAQPGAVIEDSAEAPAPELSDFEIPITPEMIDSFTKEAYDLIDQFENSLLQIQDGKNGDLVDQAFRAIHSFKGNCGFMGLADLGKLTHKMESVLELIKLGSIEASAAVISPLLNWVDVLRESVSDVSSGGRGCIPNCDLLIELINEALPGAGQPAPAPEPAESERPAETINRQEPGADTKQTSDRNQDSPAKKVARQDIRVDLSKLDSLINLVGELVIAEAMVTRHPAIVQNEDEGVERAVHQLRRVSRDLQSVAMSVRMVPLATTFQKMVRLVHDLSAKSGKKVELKLLGEDTEVDKTVIEQIADPLVHIVRNAIDHGLESPEDRSATGKSKEGHLTIEGRHEGGEVWIIISDDGRGLNREKILKKALEKGLLAGDSKDLPDQQVFKVIFEPGFSTADKITDVSGRGVGMDVVKRNIEKLKGRIDISSTPGRGTSFVLRIPLTLAIIEGMLVRVGNACYTIPILTIRESIRPLPEHITVTPEGQEIVRMREEFLPVIRLHELFAKEPENTDMSKGILVVVETDGSSVALFVDEILGQQETVIKGLSGYLSKARGVSGCTILGDGQVSLILDVATLVTQAQEKGFSSHAGRLANCVTLSCTGQAADQPAKATSVEEPCAGRSVNKSEVFEQ